MNEGASPVSVAILVLLSFISIIITGYLTIYCYSYFKFKEDDRSNIDDLKKEHWLAMERKPLIPGNFHTETIQPISSTQPSHSEEDDSLDEVDVPFKERDYSKMGRIIFVMRYVKKREELMVRLVQIEGLPVSQEIYSPNSAYVDVQLKYTGSLEASKSEVHKPPRLDICLQEVYYFIISTQQMMSHSLEFRINTFDDQFRRFVSGVVEVNLSAEMGDDILTGSEVVFVKEILEPLQMKDEDDFVSAVSDQEEEIVEESHQKASRCSSRASSNMSWEPEELSLSTNSLYFRCTSERDLTATILTNYKRSHSIGYLPTTEWTVKEIPLEDDQVNSKTTDQIHSQSATSPMDPNLYSTIDPTPESFYHIVPITPLYRQGEMSELVSRRRVAYRKHPKRKQLGRSLTVSRRSTPKFELNKPKQLALLSRSSSWPSIIVPQNASSSEVTPEHKFSGGFFEE